MTDARARDLPETAGVDRPREAAASQKTPMGRPPRQEGDVLTRTYSFPRFGRGSFLFCDTSGENAAREWR
jgi:hypothetical protein